MGNQSVSGLSESEIRQIRRLKGKIQQVSAIQMQSCGLCKMNLNGETNDL